MSVTKIVLASKSLLSRPWVFFAFALAIGLALTIPRAFLEYTSPYDEHTHLSYIQYAYNWVIPAQGYEMLSWAKDAFSCHPHSIYGPMTSVPCGVIDIGANYPTGGTNTSQNWPPTYFFIVAILMRIPSLFLSDPLYSARVITAFLWCLGTAWIGLQIFQLTKQKVLGIIVATALVALPTFYFFTSNVSPHSLNPLLFGLAFFVSNKLIATARSIGDEPPRQRSVDTLKRFARCRSLYLFLALGPLFALCVPQSLTIIGTMYLYVFFSISFGEGNLKRREKLWIIVPFTLVSMASAFVFIRLVSWWAWLSDARKIPYPPGVNIAGANSDPADPVYSSFFARIIKQWWTFWPNGIVPGFPGGSDVTAVITPWIFIVTAFSLGALIFWRRADWLSPLMVAVFVAAPVFAIAYDYYFSTDVPIRYGMGVAIIGITSLANSKMSKPGKWGISIVVALTYLSAFALDHTFVAAQTCHLNPITHLIGCG